MCIRQCTEYSKKKGNYALSATTSNETKHCHQKCGVKLCIFGDSAVFAKGDGSIYLRVDRPTELLKLN